MAKARALDKRRKAIRNIRKITRTMELIATARFQEGDGPRRGLDRLHEANHRLVADLANAGASVSIRCWNPVAK